MVMITTQVIAVMFTNLAIGDGPHLAGYRIIYLSIYVYI